MPQSPRPQVRAFVPPPFFPSGFLVALIILQAYTIFTPPTSRYAGLANIIRGTVTQLMGAWFLPASVILLVGAVSQSGLTASAPAQGILSSKHSIEGIYMYLLCNEHRVPTDSKASLAYHAWQAILTALALGQVGSLNPLPRLPSTQRVQS